MRNYRTFCRRNVNCLCFLVYSHCAGLRALEDAATAEKKGRREIATERFAFALKCAI